MLSGQLLKHYSMAICGIKETVLVSNVHNFVCFQILQETILYTQKTQPQVYNYKILRTDY